MFNGDRSAKYPNEQDMVHEGIPFINAGDLENGCVNLLNANKITTEKYNDLGGAKLQLGDIVYCLRGTLGKNAYIDNFSEGTVASSLVAIRPKNIDGKYLFYILNSDIEYSQRILHDEGAAQPNLSAKSVSEFIIPIPNIDEQKKLSSFFDSLSNLITLHQRKYDKLQVLKKAMLEKMFPKNGSSVPEIRFKGFTDAWEQRKLGDCFTERCESMPDGELISVTINDGIKKFSELGRHDNSNDDKSKYKKVCAGDIAYNSMRMWQGASGCSPYEGIVSPAYTVLTPNSGINSKCMAYQFKLPATIHTFKINSQGITSDNWNLKFPALSEIEIYVSPYEQEQAKIAAYFANLDHLITLHQRELEKLQNIKKSMLEKMFV